MEENGPLTEEIFLCLFYFNLRKKIQLKVYLEKYI